MKSEKILKFIQLLQKYVDRFWYPPFIGFLAVIGGVIMLGLPGLFIGPLIVTIIFGALPIVINELTLEQE